MPSLDPKVSRWFAAELQPHTGMLRAWLLGQFSEALDVDDVMQEAVLRVLEVHAKSPVRSPKAYLYVVARNLALMRIRCQQTHNTGSLEEIDAASLLDERDDIREAVAHKQELELLTAAHRVFTKESTWKGQWRQRGGRDFRP